MQTREKLTFEALLAADTGSFPRPPSGGGHRVEFLGTDTFTLTMWVGFLRGFVALLVFLASLLVPEDGLWGTLRAAAGLTVLFMGALAVWTVARGLNGR